MPVVLEPPRGAAQPEAAPGGLSTVTLVGDDGDVAEPLPVGSLRGVSALGLGEVCVPLDPADSVEILAGVISLSDGDEEFCPLGLTRMNDGELDLPELAPLLGWVGEHTF